MFEAGIITAIAVIWLLSYGNLKKISGHAGWVDLSTSCILGFLFIGTYAGMLTGVLASIFIGMFLRVYRKMAGYEKLQFIRLEGEWFAKPRWVSYNPSVRRS